MIIEVKVLKKAIEIKCKPIVPSKFKYQLLEKLGELYALKINHEEVYEKGGKTKISDEEKKEYLSFYNQNDFHYSFEEFLELAIFPVETIELLSKANNEKIAFIDFVPDGDVNMIWIDVYDIRNKYILLNIINNLT